MGCREIFLWVYKKIGFLFPFKVFLSGIFLFLKKFRFMDSLIKIDIFCQIFVRFISRFFSFPFFFKRFVTQKKDEQLFWKTEKKLLSKSSEQKKMRELSRNSAKQFDINLWQCVAAVNEMC